MRHGRTTLLLLGCALLVPGLALVAPAQAAPAPATAAVVTVVDPDPTDRESMRQGYLQVLQPAMQTPIGWTGNIGTCDAGAPSAAAQAATLTAVNYFRDLVGVQPVSFDSVLSAKAQK